MIAAILGQWPTVAATPRDAALMPCMFVFADSLANEILAPQQ